jgi:hypothetical protein
MPYERDHDDDLLGLLVCIASLSLSLSLSKRNRLRDGSDRRVALEQYQYFK